MCCFLRLKKLVSILLLNVFLFNLIGYKLFFNYLEYKADQELAALIDAVDDDNLIEIKIPIMLPYHTDWKDFERVDGEVVLNGLTYRYVKQKVYKDTLILLCLDFKEKSKIVKGSKDYFSRANSLTNEPNKKSVSKTFTCEYLENEHLALSLILRGEGKYERYMFSEQQCLSGFKTIIEGPPELTV
jgi:hypothetical protein